MLPTVSKGRGPSSSSTSRPPNPVFPHYLRRIVKWRQMDIEYTFWQMFHLCTSPKVVYQHTKYHKQTKNQWARDDPAFLVICCLLLAVSSLAYCAVYDHSVGHAVFVVISILLFHFLFTGVLIATCCWFLTNNYLREEVPNSHVVEQRVEWLYAFDVHCNSFFPIGTLLPITPSIGARFHTCFAVKPAVHDRNFLLPLSELSSSAFFGEDHLLSLPNWHIHHPYSHLYIERLQSVKICNEHLLQSASLIRRLTVIIS
ncbi:hypothetical protein V2J09_021147 [Rumex salicifolius]